MKHRTGFRTLTTLTALLSAFAMLAVAAPAPAAASSYTNSAFGLCLKAFNRAHADAGYLFASTEGTVHMYYDNTYCNNVNVRIDNDGWSDEHPLGDYQEGTMCWGTQTLAYNEDTDGYTSALTYIEPHHWVTPCSSHYAYGWDSISQTWRDSIVGIYFSCPWNCGA